MSSNRKKVNGIDILQVGAVVFDLGGVFLKGTVEEALRFGDSVGLSAEAWRAIHHDLFIAQGPWDEAERGN